MRRFSRLEVISILGLPMPRNGRSSYNISCPYCDTKPKQKHLNINLKKEVYRCPKCGEHGGIFDLYSLFSGVPRDKVLDDLINRTEPHEKQSINQSILVRWIFRIWKVLLLMLKRDIWYILRCCLN